LRLVRSTIEAGHPWAVACFLVCLLFAFFGLTRVVFAIVDGRPKVAAKTAGKRFKETAGVVIPPLLLLGMSLWLGLMTPSALREAWISAVAQLYPGK
jgi:hydrogenase-4 component F